MFANVHVQKPYRWGTFQGWSTAVAGLGFFLSGPFHSDPGATIASYLIGVLLFVIGTGLVGKRRFGLVLYMIFGAVVVVGAFLFPPPYLEGYFMIAGWWIVPAVFYYPKRWNEFFGAVVRQLPAFEPPSWHPTPFNAPVGVRQVGPVGASPPPVQALAKAVDGVEGLRNTAAEGSVDAQYRLGLLYEQGNGVPQDFAKAAEWYRRAGERGSSLAQHRLGLLYKTGAGVGSYSTEAYFWLYLAAQGDDRINQERFARDRDAVATQIGFAERSEVEQEAVRWLDSHRPSRNP